MTTAKTIVAVRVLTAINNKQHPEERDVFLLRAYCPDQRDLAPDELACAVIQEAMERRQEARNGRALSQNA
ncbi:MAG: hypothetical protein JWO19_3354 [Bryobacterales bacterium]|nr:hypothetical protein [Bryobacterales bacterium]